jgi:CubicO group peptidase (beta-lactamase class C family)
MLRQLASAAALLVLLSAPLSATAARQSTPAAGTPASLAGVVPLPLAGARLAEFESYVGSMLEKTGVPGAAVAVVQGGEVVYQQGFGVRALGGDAPVTPDTLMMVGSVTKPMTATMAATLVDNGKLAWDTLVVDLLPAFAVADPDLTRRLTVRDAFCACTGLPERDPELIFNAGSLTPERLVA